MTPRKGNTNALKHGLYAVHITENVRPALSKMPTDEFLMELAALRIAASQALDLYKADGTFEQKAQAIQLAGELLERVINAVSRNQLLVGSAPMLKDLWEAIDEANRLDEINVAL